MNKVRQKSVTKSVLKIIVKMLTNSASVATSNYVQHTNASYSLLMHNYYYRFKALCPGLPG